MIPRFPSILAAAVLLSAIFAFAEDSSTYFLKAYQDYQAGESFERDGRLRDALNSYASTVAILEKIRKEDPSWQEIVVNFRMRKAKESIERVQLMVASEPEKLPPHQDPLPTKGFEIDIPEPAVSTRPSWKSEKPSEADSDYSKAIIASLNRQVEGFKKQLQEARESQQKAEGEVANVKQELASTQTELVAIKSRLALTDDALRNADLAKEELKKIAADSKDKKVEKLSERIARLEAENEVAQDENDRLVNKLKKASDYIAESGKVLADTDEDRRKVASQRDKALARIKRLKDNDAQIESLTAANADLQKQLADQKSSIERLARIEAEKTELQGKLAATEKKLAASNDADGLSKAESKAFQEDMALLQDRLTAARFELAARDKTIKSLASQLDESTGELARLRLNPEPSEEQLRLFNESQLLRQIVLRQIHEQSTRNQAVADLEKELERLQVRSDKLAANLGILNNASPVLRDEERALFREPIAALRDADGGDLSLTAIKFTSGSRQSSGGAESLSEDSKKLAVEAVNLVKERRFTDAEKKYQQVVDAHPDNHFALANLAVTQIQSGKLSAARVALEKALVLKPDDVFASVNLGNVYCRQGRFDDAISILDRALASDPKNTPALNYLAIALGKKGDTSKSEEVFRQCLAIDPNYAGAHFNLAVMYVNAEPPSLQLAKKHYEIAKSLGADPDLILEKRISSSEPSK